MAASQEAVKASNDVELIKSNLSAVEARLREQKEINTDQYEQISDLSRQLSEISGAQKQADRSSNSAGKFIAPVMSVVVLVASGFIGTSIIGRINELSKEVISLTVEAKGAEERLKSVEAKKLPDLGEVNSSLAKFDTRIATIESNLTVRDANNVRRDGVLAELTENTATNASRIEGNAERIAASSKRLDDLADQAKTNVRNIAAIDARMSAGFVEVESQLRGVQAVFIGALGELRGLVGTVWQKIIGQPLPDAAPLPTNIPAQATTTIGGGAVNQ
jgi:putative NADH-flavin reductase